MKLSQSSLYRFACSTLLGLTLTGSICRAQTNIPSAQRPEQTKRVSTLADVLASISTLKNGSIRPQPRPNQLEEERAVGKRFKEVLDAGDALLRQGDLAGAIARYQSASSVLNDPAVPLRIGDALQQAGRSEEAMEAYRSALAMFPSATPHEKMGDVYAATGRETEAISEYQQAYGCQPEAEPAMKMALLYAKSRRYADAARAYEQGVRLFDKRTGKFLMRSFSPADFEQGTFEAMAQIVWGLRLGGRGLDEQAVAKERQAVRLRPDLAIAHYFLAEAIKSQVGETQEVRAEYDKAKEIDLALLERLKHRAWDETQ